MFGQTILWLIRRDAGLGLGLQNPKPELCADAGYEDPL